MAFTLPNLPYPANALEPTIDARTMEIHHDKHHAAYMNNLNNAIAGTDLEGKDIVWILSNMDKAPANIKTAVQNNGGGYANHNLFWTIMSGNGGGKPAGDLATAIDSAFGSFDAFKEKFSNAAATRFGSGWAWLVVKSVGSLDVYSTANQDSPYMQCDTPSWAGCVGARLLPELPEPPADYIKAVGRGRLERSEQELRSG